MNFDAHFRVTSYALVATAFAALALTGELYVVSILLYVIAFAVSFYRDVRGANGFELKEWMWRALAIAYLPFFFFDALALTSKVSAIIHLTLFASAVKLFQNKRDRDWVFLYLIAFFQMLLAAGLTFNAVFVVSLALFIFFFVSTLAAFEIRRTQREIDVVEEEIIMRAREPRWFRRRVKISSPADDSNKQSGLLRTRYLMGASVAQVVMVAALTLPLFFLIPRVGGGGGARGFGSSPAMTGFSEVVRLGDVAGIKPSQSVAMRVQLDRAPQKYLRWRGIALDRYDGRSWSLSESQNRRRTDTQSRNIIVSGDGSADDEDFMRRYGVGESPADPSSMIEQRIVLEPVSTGTLFSAHRLVELRGPMASLTVVRDTSLKQGEDAATVSTETFRRRISYIARSDTRAPAEQELRADAHPAYPEEIKRFYLQLPRNLDPRIEELAREMTRSAATPYDKARAVEAFFKTQFSYSLDVERTGGDPLAEFLFETREGHCEYFATAMAITLRTLDIPARVVNGFQMGEYNDINNLYTVREADAHSWVEVYFAKADAWVEFDPTPAAGINDYSQGGLLARLRKYMEAAEVFWLDYIVTLDSDEQASIMVELQQRTLAMKDQLVRYYMDFKLWMKSTTNRLLVEHEWSIGDLLLLAGLVLVLGLTVIGLNILRSHRRQRKKERTGYGPWWHRFFVLPTWRRSRLVGRDHRASAVLFYEQMLQIAARGGLVKPPDQTPAEFAAASRFDQIREITNVYNRVRFGGARLNENETRRVSTLLAALRKAVREK
jgi:transglutaminase-like putative cysteine protease